MSLSHTVLPTSCFPYFFCFFLPLIIIVVARCRSTSKVPYLGNYYLREPRSVFIMDNATIQAGVKELIEGAGAKLIYLTANSPELNPIELMFGTCIRFVVVVVAVVVVAAAAVVFTYCRHQHRRP